MKYAWIKGTVALMLIAATGVGVWAVIDKLDEATFKVLTGVVLALAIVLVVGGLFIAYGLVQAYVARRLLAQDDLSDMRQMALIARLMGGGHSPSVNLRLPPGQQGQAWPLLMQGPGQPAFDGSYRNTAAADEIEIE
jgi:hypothetical protein